MTATRLLVLGGIRHFGGRAHGYDIRRELMSWGSSEWANVNPGSIYHALKQLAKEGLLDAQEVTGHGAGPPRTDYVITAAGEAEFLRLLREAITTVDVRHPEVLSASLGFLTELPRDEAIALFQRRLTGLAEWRSSVAPHLDETGDHLNELLGWWVHSADTATEWTLGLIERLRNGAYVMAGERPRVAQGDAQEPSGPS
ncbi:MULTISPECIES: PadR family transcriptional regulator [Thermomonosporaceae]|uniref:PadR family transcriptional regulator n=1 Tax=Thermomonosporaceae TaxID=2012 RepID=UPI00255B11BE|nr:MULTISPECIES: PadR family transcriptional regulator [Thermomonosporaceae]MDL4774667.1 PadR family transcriptional regulator [Actinomadura xylanilytica]